MSSKNTRSCLFVVLLSLAISLPAFAQNTEKKKSPEDLAAEAFFALKADKEAKPDAARFQKLIGSGVAFIVQYPTHKRTPDAIRELPLFAATMREKNQAALRSSYISALEYEVVNQRTKPDINDDARAAIAALDASTAGIRTRELANRENLEAYREKIDTLAQLPSAGRFLAEQERGYVEVMMYIKPSAGEAHLRKCLEHPDKKVAGMAREELNFVELWKAPYELKFTAMDGREVDFAQMRGKVVLMSFWTSGNAKASKEHAGLKDLYDLYHKKGFEVIGVACDKEEDREKMTKFVKENRLPWPQYYDGKEFKNDFGSKLNVRNAPVAFLFDQQGYLLGKSVRVDQLDPVLKKMLIK